MAGFIIRSESPIASNWRAEGTLREYLVRNNIVAISNIDTRALTKLLRSSGVMRGVVATGRPDPDALVARARAIPQMEGADLVQGVTCDAPFDFVPPKEDDEFQLRWRAKDAAPAAHRRVRPRHEVEHPAAVLGVRLRRARVSGEDAGVHAARDTSPTACS